MPRTVLVADPDCSARERVSEIAQLAGYRVLRAQNLREAVGALDACPISAVVIAEELLRGSDIAGLLLRAPAIVLREERGTSDAEGVFVLPNTFTPSQLIDTLVRAAGEARFPGRRHIIAFREYLRPSS